MSRPFQILLVDDDPSDTELIELQLKKLDLKTDIYTVTGKNDFESFLENNCLPDIVVCDYHLNGYTGEMALKKVREYHPYLPFILVSGYLNEEEAVQLMRMGASDILTKQRLERFGPAVKRELINYRDKVTAEEEVQKAQNRFRALVEQGGDMVSVLDEHGNHSYITPSVHDVLGYTVEEAKKININKLIHSDDFGQLDEALETARTRPHKSIQVPPIRMKHKDGTWRWYKSSLTDLRHEPSVNGIVNSIRDIHDQVMNARINMLMLNNTEDSFIYINTDLIIQNFNNLFAKNYKDIFDVDVKRGDSILDYARPDRREAVKSIYKQVFRGETVERELPLEMKNGKTRYFQIKYKPAKDEKDNIVGSFISLIEKTEEHLAKLELEKNEARFRALVENADDVVFILSPDAQPTYISPSIKKVLGYSLEEATEIDLIEKVHPDDIEHVKNELAECLEHPGVPLSVTPARMQHKNGSWRWFEGTITNMLHDPAIGGIVDNFHDITERVKAEEKYRNVVEHSTNMFYQHDTEGVLTYVSPQSKSFLGYSPEEAIGSWTDYLTDHPLNKKGEKITRKALETGEVQPPYELQLRNKSGNNIWVEVHEAPLKKDGEITGIVGSLTDVSERKQYEVQLQESLERYEYASKATRDAIYDWDINKDHFHWGDGFKKLFGHEPGTGKFPLDKWASYVHPDDIEETRSSLETNLNDRSTNKWQHQYRFTKSEGSYAHVVENGYIIRDQNGKAIRMIGALRDITESRQAEIQARLKQQVSEYFRGEERLNIILDRLLKYLAEYNKFSLAEIWLVSSSQNHLNLISTSYRDAAGRSFYQKSKDVKRFARGEGLPGSAWKSNNIEIWDQLDVHQDFARRSASGNSGICSACALPLFYNKKPVGVLLLGSTEPASEVQTKINPYEILQDFLGAEIKRKQQEEEMSLLFKSSPDILAITSPNKRFINVNPAFCEILGFTHEELTTQNFENFLHPDDREDTLIEYEETISGKRRANNYVNRWRTKAGEYRWISWSSSDIFGEDGLVFAFGRDVTERTELANLLGQAHRMARIGGWEVDLVNENVYWSPITKEIHEVEPNFEPVLESGINFYKKGESRTTIRNVINEAIENGTAWDVELQIITGKGNERWIRAKGEPELIDGKCVRLYGSFQDIHDRKEAEIELDEALKEKKTILESIGDAFFAVDGNWKVTYWNKEAEKVLQKPRVEIIGKNLWEVYEDAIELEFYTQYHKAVNEQRTVHFEEYYPTLNIWFEVSAYPADNGLSVYFKDITDRKQASIELEQAYNEKETILESIDDGFFTLSRDWTVTYWNSSAEELLHTPKEKILGKNLWDIFDDAVDLPSYKKYHRAMDDGMSVSFEDYYEPIDSWFDVNAYPSDDGISVYFKDITKRKENEEKIRRINERFEKVTEATNDAIWDFDVQEDNLYWGKGFETLFGYNIDDAKPSLDFLVSLIHPDDRKRVADKIKTYMSTDSGTEWFEEYRFKKVDESYAYVMDRAVFIRNANGTVIRVVGAMTDLTRQKEYEESLKKLNEELEIQTKELAASNAELEQFAYVASHDLQEPLRMVSSFLTQLEKKYSHQLDDKAHKYIYFAVDGAQRMRQIILDLLNYSRLNQDRILDEEIDLNEILEEIQSLEKSHIRKSGAQVTIATLPTIRAKRGPVKQVFQNLLNNAIKYHKPGKTPRIEIKAEELNDHWKFSVSDNGIGIRPDFQENIFQIFQRLHTRDKYSGTGIGLAVVKKIVERHGGQVWVESEEGKGSTFYFSIEKKG